MIFRLDERIIFPEPALADEDGLLAVGGDLSPARLKLAYQNGIFPWYNDDTPILWYSPHTRFVLFPKELNISKTMRKVIASGQFRVTSDTAFADVVNECSQVPRKDQEGTWITEDMKAAYIDLFNMGIAHSYEVWQCKELVGGLYGVAVGSVFCGESMFSKASNASKTALVSLCKSGLYKMIDCQVYTAHLESLGARMISRDQYLEILRQ